MEQVAVKFPKLGLEFPITREAFVIGDFAIYWYAIFIAVGAILAVIYAMINAKKYGINPDKLLDLGIVGLIFGIIGARLYYVIFNIENYKNFADIINIRDGGLAIYGGLILGVVSAFIASRINKTRFLPSLDIAAGGFLIGQALGRWGNFVNQEAFGVNTDSIFGMYSAKTQTYLESVAADLYFDQGIMIDPSKPVHPCFLYESVWCIIGFLLILLYRKHRKFDGELILFYAAWYGSGRALIEGIRTDSLMIGPFRVSQLVSIIIAVLAVAAIIMLRIKISKKRTEDPDYLKLYVDTEESRAQFMDDDETVIKKAEELLTDAEHTLDSAQHNLNLILNPNGAPEKKEDDSQNELENLATEMQEPEKILELIEKQIELTLTQAMMASTLLERFEKEQDSEPEQQVSEIEPDAEGEDESEEELDFKDKLSIVAEQIASTYDYIYEYFDLINQVKNRLSEPKQQETEAEIKEQEEISEPLPNEEDEMDIPSPHANK